MDLRLFQEAAILERSTVDRREFYLNQGADVHSAPGKNHSCCSVQATRLEASIAPDIRATSAPPRISIRVGILRIA